MKKLLLVGIALLICALPGKVSAAIAVDSSSALTSSGWYNCGTSCSWNHTVSGSDRILLVYLTSNAGDVVTGVTYNSTSLTQLVKKQRFDGATTYSYIYYLVAPATGTNSVAVSLSSSDSSFMGAAISYTGAAQSAPEAASSTSQSGSSASVSVTTLTNNAWLSGMFYTGSGANMTAGNNTTFRSGAVNTAISADSGAPYATAGSYSLNANTSGSWIAVVASIAPSSQPVTNITGSGTINRIAKFTSSTAIGDSLFSDDGSNTTLTSGNLFLQVNALIDAASTGVLNLGTTNATTINLGRSGQAVVINSKVGISTSTPAVELDINGSTRTNSITAGTISTKSNCASTASPAVCGSAASGSIAVPSGTDTLTVNTTAVTANSVIIISENFGLDSRLGVTCNTANSRRFAVSSFTAGTSFTIKASANITTNPACLNYLIIN